MINPPIARWIHAGIPALVLAPMEGVTDQPMREFLAQLGGFTFCVTEFIRISNSVPGAPIFRQRVPELRNDARTPAGLSVQTQLLGGDPDLLAEAAAVAVQAGSRALDLNFGCPTRTVNRHDGGATLLRYPQRIRAIVAAVRQAVPPEIPVSAKLRLGWDDPCSIHENAERAAEGGAAWIIIHGRTKAQGYRAPADWGPIREVRERLRIPVVANGDIWTIEDLRRCQGETGCEHFMLGRGALANPTLARAAARWLGSAGTAVREVDVGEGFFPGQRNPSPQPLAPEYRGEGLSNPSMPADWLPLVLRFVRINAAAGRSPDAMATRIKQWLNLANHDGKLHWFDALKRQQGLVAMLAHLSALCGIGSTASPEFDRPPSPPHLSTGADLALP